MKAAAALLLAALAVQGGVNAWTPVNPAISLPAGRQGTLQGTGWNTWTYRPSAHALLFYDRYVGEGLPNTIYGNALTSWDIAAGRVEVLSISDTAPLERHTYEAFAYVAGEDAVYMVSGATRGCGSDAKLWRYRFASKAWEDVAGSLPEHYGCEVHLLHWAAGNSLILIDGWNKVLRYDLAAGAWSAPHVSKANGVDVYGAKSAWDAERNRWVFWGGNNGAELAAYDPAAGAITLLPVKGARPASHGHMGIAHLAGHGAYMVAGGTGGGETWVYDVASSSWTLIPGAGAPEGQTSLFHSAKDDRVYLLDACQGCMKRMAMDYRPGGAAAQRNMGIIGVTSDPAAVLGKRDYLGRWRETRRSPPLLGPRRI